MRFRLTNKKTPQYTYFGAWLFHAIEAMEPANKKIIAAFGRKVGISQAQLYRYFIGTKCPSRAALKRICRRLKVPLTFGVKMIRETKGRAPRHYN